MTNHNPSSPSSSQSKPPTPPSSPSKPAILPSFLGLWSGTPTFPPPLPPGRVRRPPPKPISYSPQSDIDPLELDFFPPSVLFSAEKEQPKIDDAPPEPPQQSAWTAAFDQFKSIIKPKNSDPMDDASPDLGLSLHNPNPPTDTQTFNIHRRQNLPMPRQLRMPRQDHTMLDLRLTVQGRFVDKGKGKRPRQDYDMDQGSSDDDSDDSDDDSPPTRPRGESSSGAGLSTGCSSKSSSMSSSSSSGDGGGMSLPFSCGECDKRFTSVFALMDHIKMRPLHLVMTFARLTINRPPDCDIGGSAGLDNQAGTPDLDRCLV